MLARHLKLLYLCNAFEDALQFRSDAHGARKPRARSGRALRTEQSRREREATLR